MAKKNGFDTPSEAAANIAAADFDKAIENEGDNTPSEAVPSSVLSSNDSTKHTKSGAGKGVRLFCEDMKGRKLFLNDGSVGEFDSDGYIDVSEEDALRLLKIPVYKKG